MLKHLHTYKDAHKLRNAYPFEDTYEAMNKHLAIQRIPMPYEEEVLGIVNLIVKAVAGDQSGILEIYAEVLQIKTLAIGLEQFPRSIDDEITWEIGSEDPDTHAYFLFRVFNPMENGWVSGIQIRFNNNKPIPFNSIVDFCMPCEPAGLNRLGKLFSEFAKLEATQLIWDGVDGEILL